MDQRRGKWEGPVGVAKCSCTRNTVTVIRANWIPKEVSIDIGE